MAVMDEFKEERESLKKAPFKKKMEYFWMYYKWYVVCGIAVILLVYFTATGILGTKDDVINGVAVDAKATDSMLKELYSAFLTEYGYDEKKEQVYFHCNLHMGDNLGATMQQTNEYISAQMFGNALDICIMKPQFFSSYAYDCNFLDLSVYFDEEVLDLFEGHIYYVDLPIAETYVERLNNNLPVDDIVIPDPTKPELMKDPHPVGIDISAFPDVMEAFGYEEGPIYLGVVKNTKRLDSIEKFLVFLSSYERN